MDRKPGLFETWTSCIAWAAFGIVMWVLIGIPLVLLWRLIR